MICHFQGKKPRIHPEAWAAPTANIIGDVTVGRGSSIWFTTVLRGDYQAIRIGENSSLQDGTVVHITRGIPSEAEHPGLAVEVGSGVTIGHRCVIHACRIADNCLIGMGAVILDGARIEEESIVGAGALVTKGKSFPPRSLILGAPAKAVRNLTEMEVAGIYRSAENYRVYTQEYIKESL